MKTKITTTTAAVLLGMSSLASAQPLEVPPIYNNGPLAPRLNVTDMRVVEKAAFALNEAAMQAAEASIYSRGSCVNSTMPIEVYVHPEPTAADPDNHDAYLQDTSLTGTFRLNGKVYKAASKGQNFDVDQPYNGTIGGWPTQGLRARYTYNDMNNMMVGENFSVQAKSQTQRNGVVYDNIYGSVIKDFYHGDAYDPQGDYFEIYDYGLQSVSKDRYPVNKWWQRSVATRDNGSQGCTVFQKDRLVGTSECRIVIAINGYSQEDMFWQKGTLSVQKVKPSAPSVELDACSAGN